MNNELENFDTRITQNHLPVQTELSDFDNFIGLKFGSGILENIFKLRCFGWKVTNAFFEEKLFGKNLETVVFRNTESSFFDCPVESLRLSYSLEKNKGFLLSQILIVFKNNDENIDKIVKLTEILVQKYNLQRKTFFVHPSTGRELQPFDSADKNYIILVFCEKGAKETLKNEQKLASFLNPYKYQYELFLGTPFYVLNKLNENQQDLRLVTLLAANYALSSESEKRFLAFWDSDDKKKYFSDFATKVQQVFDEPREDFDFDKISKQFEELFIKEESDISEKIAAAKEAKRLAREKKKTEQKENGVEQKPKKRIKNLPNLGDVMPEHVLQAAKLKSDDMEIFDRLMEKWLDVFSRPLSFTAAYDSEEIEKESKEILYEAGINSPFNEYNLDSCYRSFLEGLDNYLATEYSRMYEGDGYEIRLYLGSYIIPRTRNSKEPERSEAVHLEYRKYTDSGEAKSMIFNFYPYAEIGTRLELRYVDEKQEISSGIMIIQKPEGQVSEGLSIQTLLEFGNYKKVQKHFEDFLEQLLRTEENLKHDAYNEYKENTLDGLDDL